MRLLLARLEDDSQAIGGDQVLALLDLLDAKITGLLDSQPESDDQVRWLQAAKALLRMVGRLIVAAATAMAVTCGALLATGGHPAASDEIQAVAGLVIGAACGLLQRDVQLAWHQPDISMHLSAARELLGGLVEQLCTALKPGDGLLPAVTASAIGQEAAIAS